MGSLEEIEVLVTGATGFIGSHLVKRLVNENCRVNVISRNEIRLKNNPIINGVLDQVKIFHSDLQDHSTLQESVNAIKPEKIFHMGALVVPYMDFETASNCVQTNIQGTLNLLNASKDLNYSSFIHMGSYEVYGHGKIPFSEEQHPDPISPYSISKVSSELFCRYAIRNYNSPITLLRLSNVYGPNQNPERLIPYVIKSCLKKKELTLTKGEQTRDFLYIEDAIEGIIRSSVSKKAISETINIASGTEVKIKNVVEKILDITGNPVIPDFTLENRAYEPERWYCNITKAKKILDWEPIYDLDKGLEKTVRWYEDNE
jgi:nucleoside-diphosphate-sugar epimerase